MNNRVAIAYGDGIGPEIMESVLSVFRAAELNLSIDVIEVGKKLYTKGFDSGISPSSWETVLNNKILLKAPITTPFGGGYKSLNVTFRKGLGLYANIRPMRSFSPFIQSYADKADIVVIRENEEDLYAGIEYRLSHDTYQSLKLVSRQGCEKIIKYAFDYAVSHNRQKVTCCVKDNIMKMTDGLFSEVFDEVAKSYPSIENNKIIVDIGTARMAKYPEDFDVIVTMNLYGDIISDVIAEMLGSVGTCGSANIGDDFAMFEAIHGSAPDIAGKNIANPSGLLNASIMMLKHINLVEKAALIENALLKTVEDGIHTADMYSDDNSSQKVSTTEFTDAVIARMGSAPEVLKTIEMQSNQSKASSYEIIDQTQTVNRELVGIDLYVFYKYNVVDDLVTILQNLGDNLNLQLQMISSRGLQIWPINVNEKEKSEVSQCRFVSNQSNKIVTQQDILSLFISCNDKEIDIVKTENLYLYDGKIGFSLSQGQ
ncbi:MAG: NADP-dependent isocitrate dehydrogenase [Rickettsiales bacterium]|jgi:isocitrate dehydrogenase|nr:NADP-dependent isocitrate dehydrogenase [Rickettsiales bacterium]